MGVHVNREHDLFDTTVPPCFNFVPGLYFIHATWKYDATSGQNINRLKLYTLPHTAGDPPVHDSGDQVYTYVPGEDLTSPYEYVLNSSSLKSTYLRLGGYNYVSHFREYGSLSEFHFYKARLSDAQETHLLSEMNTKWSAIA